MRLAALLLSSLALTARAACPCPTPNVTCPAAPAGKPSLRPVPAAINGVFVVLDEASDWRPVFERLACAGVTNVIIQSVDFDRDAARKLVDAAITQRDVKVYAGLHDNDRFNAATSSLSEALAADQRAADHIATWSEAERRAIAGWYVANEIHNFRTADAHRVAELRQYLLATTSYVHDRVNDAGREVLIAPNFNPTVDPALLDAAATCELFHDVFTDSGVDVVLLQDGMGARNCHDRIGCCRWGADAFAAQAYAYERAVCAAVPQCGVDVEAFVIDPKDCKCDCPERTTTAAQFELQRRLVPAEAKMVVAYSLEHLRALWRSFAPRDCRAP